MYNNDPKYTDPPEAGLASLLSSRGRNGDTALVHMAPEELSGLQQLAVAHGGSLTVNPDTGLYEANILKKILPMVIGAVLPSVPGLGKFASGIGEFFGASGAAASTLGTGLLVGGVTGLIEGDLKKGLMAGLGAYSGANIAQALQGASVGAGISPEKVSAEELAKTNQAIEAAKQTVGAKPVYNPTGDAEKVGIDFFQSANKFKGTPTVGDLEIGRQAIATGATRPDQILDFTKSANAFRTPITDAAKKITGYNALQGTPTAADLTAGRAANIAGTGMRGVGEGIASLVQSPQARGTFINRLGGGFESPFMQSLSRNATLMGVMDAFTPEYEMPSGGSEDDLVYISGGVNPMYSYGREHSYFLPGQYYKRTKKGLVPYNPYAMAPGYAEGGPVFGGQMIIPAIKDGVEGYYTDTTRTTFVPRPGVMPKDGAVPPSQGQPPVGVAPPKGPPLAQPTKPLPTEPPVGPPPIIAPPDNPFDPARQRYMDMINAPPPPPVDTKPTMDYLDELSRRARKPEFMVFPPGGIATSPGTGGTGGAGGDKGDKGDKNEPGGGRGGAGTGTGGSGGGGGGITGGTGTGTGGTGTGTGGTGPGTGKGTGTGPKTGGGPPGTGDDEGDADPNQDDPDADEKEDDDSLLDKAKGKFMEWFDKRFRDPYGLVGTAIGLTGAGMLGTWAWDKLTPNIKKFFATPEGLTEAQQLEIEEAVRAQLEEEKAKQEKAEKDKENEGRTSRREGRGGEGRGGAGVGGGAGGGGFGGGGGGRRGKITIEEDILPARSGGRIRAMQAGGLPTPPNPYGAAVGEDYNFGFAGGGMPEYKAGGKLLDGPGDGMSDSIPAVIRGKGVQRAALADGEFVVPADVVSHLGNGSTKAGAKKLYAMMDRIRQARTGKTKQAPEVKADKYMPA